MPPFTHETVEECLQYLRDEAKNALDIFYGWSKDRAKCNETTEHSIYWFAKSVQCPVDDDFRISLKIRYRKCPDEDIYEYFYNLGLYVDRVLTRGTSVYEYPPHHTPFLNRARNMIDDFFQPGVGPFPASSSNPPPPTPSPSQGPTPSPNPSPSPSPNGDDDDDEFPIWDPLESKFWVAENYAMWVYVGILVVALGLIGLMIFLIVSSKRGGDDLF